MQLAEIKNIFHKELSGLYPKEEIDSFFYQAIEHFLNLERFVLVIRPNLTLNKEEQQPLFETLSRLKTEEPLQYIFGEAHFMDLVLNVNEQTLIPRPETEELVQWVLSDINNKKSGIRILDIGTGTGCIAIALAKNLPKAEIYALDISEDALKVAKNNAELNKVSVQFIQTDILNLSISNSLNTSFDVIISNPPYVRDQEKIEMHNNVKQFEPSTALFVSDDNPLVFYKAISYFAKGHLAEKGSLYLEINQFLAAETKSLFEEQSFVQVELKKDIFDNDRMLKCQKK